MESALPVLQQLRSVVQLRLGLIADHAKGIPRVGRLYHNFAFGRATCAAAYSKSACPHRNAPSMGCVCWCCALCSGSSVPKNRVLYGSRSGVGLHRDGFGDRRGTFRLLCHLCAVNRWLCSIILGKMVSKAIQNSIFWYMEARWQ